MPALYTTLGPMNADQLGFILPHEHIFVDLRTPDVPGFAEADTDEVVRVMSPRIAEIQQQGVTALVECTTGGVGRRADIDLAVSQATGLPVVVPTGNYREPWIPDWVKSASEADLEAWMVRELDERFDEADFKAGWIKLSAGDDGITDLEARILRAAVRAAKRCNATIGSHTIRGRVVMDQLDIIEAEGGDPSRFISIHTQAEPDFELHKQVTARGAWIEFDNAGWVPDDDYLMPVLRALDAGLEKQMLLSHDAGWFDPAKPAGGEQKPYTVMAERILPALRQRGVSDETILLLTHTNPFNAFAR